jgi:hypothetical protein
MKRSDRITAVIVLSAVVVLAIVWVFMHRAGGSVASIRVDGNLVATVDLTSTTPRTLRVAGVIGPVDILADGKGFIRVVDATCPDQICVKTSPAHSPGDQIICVPNRMVITVERGRTTIDALAQ